MASWTYSDWITSEPGSSTRVTRLRLHVQEVSNRLASLQEHASAGDVFKKDTASTERYLASLHKKLEQEEQAYGAANGTRVGWSRGKCPQ